MFSKAKTGRLDIPKKERNHNGATFLCGDVKKKGKIDATAEMIIANKKGYEDNPCLNPLYNCRGSVSGTHFTKYDSMPTNSALKRGQKSLLKKAMQGCKLSLTNSNVRAASNKVDDIRSGFISRRKAMGDRVKKNKELLRNDYKLMKEDMFGPSGFEKGGKSRRKKRKSKKRKSRKKRRKSKKRKSRRKRRKSRRRRRR